MSVVRALRSSASTLGRSRRHASIAVVVCVACWLVVCCANASAVVTHTYLSQLTGFGNARGVAFDAAGDVYVADAEAKTIERFTAAGVPLSFSASAPYVTGAKLTGTGSGSFGGPRGVAVDDETGNVYVADGVAQVVDVFSSTGQYLSQLTGTPGAAPVSGPFKGPFGLTVDQATHDLYVTDPQSGVVDVFDAAGGYVTQFGAGVLSGNEESVAIDDLTETAYVGDSGPDAAFAFDVSGGFLAPRWGGESTPQGSLGGGFVYVGLGQSSGHLYVTGTALGLVDEFAAGSTEEYVGQLLGTPTGTDGALEPFNHPQAVGVDPANGDLYIADVGTIDVFGPDIIIPGTSVQAPSGLTESAATLSGTVEPDGLAVSSCEFEYGKTLAYGHSSPCEQSSAQIGEGSAPVPVSASVSGLEPNSLYHVRLKATNVNGANVSSDQSFTTLGPPQVSESAEVARSKKAGQDSAVLQGDVNPDGRETTYRFEYGLTTSYGTNVPVSPVMIGAGEESIEVAPAELSGLTVGTIYHYRLVATNEYGTTDGPDEQFTTLGAALVDSESVSSVEARAATLEAEINPLGSDTHYYFQYGLADCQTSPAACSTVPALPGTDIGSAETDQSASTRIQGLTQDTTYHYRAIATNALGTVEGPDHTLTTPTPIGSEHSEGCANEQLRVEQPYGLELPDCRAYEMVSPLDKGDDGVAEGLDRASVSGEAIAYLSKGEFAEPAGAAIADRYISRRGADGWSTRNISPPYNPYQGNVNSPFGELLFTPDLSKGLLRSEFTPLTSGSPAGYINLYLEDTTNNSYEAVTGAPPGVGPYLQTEEACREPERGGVSTDLSHVVFGEYARGEGLTPEASPNHAHVYEWVAGHLSLVDMPPEGMTLEGEDYVGSGCEAGADRWNAVSSNGLRVFFTDASSGSGGGEIQRQMYVREVDRAKTIEVSASQKTNGNGPDGTDENGPKPARYWDASTDGSRVFFTSAAELTDDANTGLADNAANLYEYDVETGVLSDLSVDANPGDIDGAAVLGLVTAGDDGSYVYFVAEGRLAEGAVSDKPNLYLHHAGKVTFIATLAPSRRTGTGEEEEGDGRDWEGAEEALGPGDHTVRVTPDGTQLAFESERSLTGYDNEPVEPHDCRGLVNGEFEPVPCKEIYVYDAGAELTCVSCDPSGARPVGGAELGEQGPVNEATKTPGVFYLQRNFSEDGRRLFFQSPDALVPHDSNGRQDVYEYENGNVYPISDVAGNSISYFLDASASGDDVFIATADQLLPSDTDFHIDVYDVKVGGGFPVSITPPVCVNGDSCKGPVSPQPGVFGPPASATFSGAGNVSPVVIIKPTTKKKVKAKREQRCRKSRVRRHGRCMKQTVKSSGHSKKGRK